MRTVKPLRFTDYESRGYPPDRKSLGNLLALFLVLIWNGIHAHSHELLLVAGEGFEPSKAEPGDLQSSVTSPGFPAFRHYLRLNERKSKIFRQ